MWSRSHSSWTMCWSRSRSGSAMARTLTRRDQLRELDVEPVIDVARIGTERGAGGGLGSAAVQDQRRGILMAVAGLVVLAANVIDAANRGSSAWNVIAIV